MEITRIEKGYSSVEIEQKTMTGEQDHVDLTQRYCVICNSELLLHRGEWDIRTKMELTTKYLKRQTIAEPEVQNS